MPLIDGTRLEMVAAINASAPNSNARLFLMLPAILEGKEPLAVQAHSPRLNTIHTNSWNSSKAEAA